MLVGARDVDAGSRGVDQLIVGVPKKKAASAAPKPASAARQAAGRKPAPAAGKAGTSKKKPAARKRATAAKASATLLTPSESQKIWLASVLLFILLGAVAWIGGEIHPTPTGYRAGIRDLKGRVQWWLDLERGHWPTIKHRT